MGHFGFSNPTSHARNVCIHETTNVLSFVTEENVHIVPREASSTVRAKMIQVSCSKSIMEARHSLARLWLAPAAVSADYRDERELL